MVCLFKSMKFKALTAGLMTFFMVTSLITPVGLDKIIAKADASSKTFDLIEITDFHGNLLSSYNEQIAAVMAKDVKTVEAQNPDTFVLGGGDFYQGTPISNVLVGVPVQQFLTNVGMKVTALGNHEFDWTKDSDGNVDSKGALDLINTVTMKNAGYNIVCANLRNKSDNSLVYPAYQVYTEDNVRIAVIGAITTETPDIVMPANVANYTFTDPATEINDAAAEIKKDNKADVVLAVVHEGSNGDFTTTGPIMDIANNLHGVDAVFGGHSHTIMSTTTASGMPVEIASANGKGYIDLKMNIDSTGKITFPNASAGSATGLDKTTGTYGAYQAINRTSSTFPYGYYGVTSSTSSAVDSDVYNIVKAANDQVAPIFNTKIGTAAGNLTKTQDVQPYGESQLGNWTADVIKNYTKADIGIVNNGGIRCNINAGDITKGMIFTLMPFDDTIETTKLTGAQLRTMFENAFADGGKGIQISGIKVTYSSKLSSGNRVISMAKSDGTPIDINDTKTTYTVAGPDFVLTGGDGFTVFNTPAIKAALVDTHELIRDALMDDVSAKGTIKTEMDNRIANDSSVIRVIATSDNHGAVFDYDYASGAKANAGLTRVSTYVKAARTQDPDEVMVVDNGDTIQGTPLSYYFDKINEKAEYPMMKAYGLIGYDTWTLGNHEFNYGLEVLNRVIGDAKYENIKVLSANIYNTKDNSNAFGTYYIKPFTVNGKTIRVGILGMTTPAIPNWEDASHYAGLTFQKNLVTEAQKYVDQMRAKQPDGSAGADVVILTVHSGQPGTAETIPEENQVTAIAEQTTGIDAIVAGHTHDVYGDNLAPASSKPYIKTVRNNKDGKPVHITEPKNGATYVSEVDIKLNSDGTLSTDPIFTQANSLANVADDTNFEAAMQSYQDSTIEYVNTVLGTSTAEFSAVGQYTRPTALMDLINKIQMKAAGTQLSIAAPLSDKAAIHKGNVTIKDLMSVYVYENFLYGVKMNGKQIKDWLEWSARYYKQVSSSNDPLATDPAIPGYNYDMLYGATYTIDRTQPVGHRIKNLAYNGVPINDSQVFTVAINNYRYNGGGGFMSAAGLSMTDPKTGLTVPKPGITVYDSAKALGDDGQVRNIMMNYIKDLTTAGKTLDSTLAGNWIAAPAALAVSPSSSTVNINSTIQLTGTIKPTGSADPTIVWTSDNPLLASVDSNGLVTTNGLIGDVTITAVSGDGILSGTCKLHISDSAVVDNNYLNVTRIAGQNRFDTSGKIAETYSNGGKVDNIILASGRTFPDAVTGGVLTSKLNAPMLLVGSNKDNEKIYDYIKNNLASDGTVYILGGTGAVSQDVEDYVSKTLKVSTVRISGTDRFETNEKIIEKLNPAAGTPVILAKASDFPDALSASGIASIKGYPIILVQGKDLSDSAKKVLTNIKPGTVYVIGGTGAVDDNIITEVKKAVTTLTDKDITRIAGQNRYETSMNVVKYFNLNIGNLMLTSGSDFPDALSGTALAAKEYAPILITSNGAINDELTVISKYSNITILGGYGAVSQKIEELLKTKNSMPSSIQTSLNVQIAVGTAVTKEDLPKTILGIYPDGTEVPVNVTWDTSKVTFDTSKAGTITVTGAVAGYDTPVTLTITVI